MQKRQKTTGVINYGFGKDYLSNWGLKEAFREIYQNFLDYGTYEEEISPIGEDKVHVRIWNNWKPDSLEFLRIGNSKKSNKESLGKHGEGLKMAFLILLREGFKSTIITPLHLVRPAFVKDLEIGEVFSLRYKLFSLPGSEFEITFEAPADVFTEFHNNIIREKDVIFTSMFHGSIVDRPVGHIFCGGLFVARVNNLSNAYNLLPSNMTLDRDRSVPLAFDVNYHCSKIKEEYGKFSTKDFSYSDSEFITRVPDHIKKTIKPVRVGNNIELTYKNEEGKTTVITNHSIKESLIKDSFFEKIIKKIRNRLAKSLGLYDLLLDYQQKYVHGENAKAAFQIILNKVNPEAEVKQETELPF